MYALYLLEIAIGTIIVAATAVLAWASWLDRQPPGTHRPKRRPKPATNPRKPPAMTDDEIDELRQQIAGLRTYVDHMYAQLEASKAIKCLHGRNGSATVICMLNRGHPGLHSDLAYVQWGDPTPAATLQAAL